MDQIEFLQTVLPPTGTYFVGSLNHNKSFNNKPYSDIASAISAIQQLKAKRFDVYIATGSFKDGSSREGANVAHRRCFVIDLDCGHKKEFATKKEAFTAFTEFMKATKFPRPSVIMDSGNGFHVYWALETPVPTNQWERYALGIKSLCEEAGLKIDRSVTGDAARVMRVPDTLNYKDPAAPKPCKILSSHATQYSLASFDAALAGHVARDSTVVNIFGDVDNDDLTSAGKHGPKYAKHIINECGAFKYVVETGGKHSDEKEWKQMLNLLVFCADGEAYVHPVSKGHPDYTPRETQYKFEQRIKAQERSGFGAPTCESLSKCLPEQCADCPHWKDPDRGKNWSSPLHFGVPIAERALPFPYVIEGHQIMVRQEEGAPKLAIPYKFDTIDVYLTHGVGMRVAVDMQSEHGSDEVVIDAGAFADGRALHKDLTKHGVVLDDKARIHMAKLMTAFTQKMAKAKKTSPLITQYGWVKGHKQEGFAVGDHIYWEDGRAERTLAPDKNYSKLFEPTGTLDGWKQSVAWALEAEHVESEVIIATAFAAPLVPFTNVPGVLLSAMSRASGTGKSTALKLAQAVWAEPRRTMHSLDDTTNAIARRVGLSNNLPALWDEVRVHDKATRGLVNFIYQLSQGREKARMTAQAEIGHNYSWSTMMVTCSNTGLMEHIAGIDKHTEAGMLRVFEFEVSRLDATKAHDATDFHTIEDNYGHCGVEYAKYLAENRAAVQERVAKTHKAVIKRLNCVGEERFLAATIATLIVGASIAKEQGWVQFNVKAITSFLSDTVGELRSNIRDSLSDDESTRNVYGMIKKFLDQNNSDVLVTDWITAVPGPSGDKPTQKNDVRCNSPVAQIGESEDMVRILTRPLKDFARDEAVSGTWLMKELEADGILVQRKRLGYKIIAGFGSVPRSTVDIPMSKLYS